MPTQTINVAADGTDEGGWFTDDTLFVDSGAAAGLSFLISTEIPAGSTINEAFISLYCTFQNSPVTIEIAIEDADPETNTAWGTSHRPQIGTFYTPISTGSITLTTSTRHFGNGESNETDIKAAIQSLLDEYGTLGVNYRINIRVATGANSGQFEALQAGPTNHATLYIDSTEGAGGGESGSYGRSDGRLKRRTYRPRPFGPGIAR